MQFVSFRGGSSFFCPGKVAGSLLVQIPLFCGGNYIILSGYPSWKLTWFFPISPYIFGAFEDVFSYFPRWGVCYTCTCSFLESHVWRSIGPKTRGPSEQMINCWGLLRCRGAKKTDMVVEKNGFVHVCTATGKVQQLGPWTFIDSLWKERRFILFEHYL